MLTAVVHPSFMTSTVVPSALLLVALAQPLSGASLTRNITRFVGYNVVNLQSGNFTDPRYTEGSAALNAGVLRYPGGNLADWWDWRTGWCVKETECAGCPASLPSVPKKPGGCKNKPRQYFLDEFVLALRATNARPVMMMNMLTANLTDQLEYLRAARSAGALPAGAFVELGGEFYWGKFTCKFENATVYANVAKEWATAVKVEFPDVQVMAIAGFSTADADPKDRGYQWNGLLYAALAPDDDVDGVTLHPYLHLGDDKRDNDPLQPLVPARTKGDGPTGWTPNATVQQAMVDLLRTEKGLEALMGIPFFAATLAEASNVATRAKLPSHLSMLITEWNVMERSGPIKLSWAHALMTASMTYNLIGIKQVVGVCMHVLLNGWGWGALYETTSDFVPTGTPPPGSGNTADAPKNGGCLIAPCLSLKTQPYGLTAVGTALSAIGGAMAGATMATKVAFPDAPVMQHGALPYGLPGNVAYPSLLGWKFHAPHVPANISLLNLGPIALSAASMVDAAHVRAWTVWTSPGGSDDLASWASTATPVRVNSSTQTGTLPLLPPYSIATLMLKEVQAGRV